MNELEFQVEECIEQIEFLKKFIYVYTRDIYRCLSKDDILDKINNVRDELNKLECMLNN